MREIKFRAWNKAKNRMEYDVYKEYDNLMQYTGLKDKNEKEIYEGDILQINIKDKTIKNKIISAGNAVVEYKNCKFGVVWGWHKDFICLDGFYNTDFKIKGNIYGNPELLEG
nr:YopX family protein [Clostridium botulinum]